MIANHLRTLLQNPFWRNVGILTGGTVIAQAIMVLALPALTRIYTPDDFNLLAVYASTLGLLTVASCLRFNIAIPMPSDDRTAMDLLILALLAGASVACLAAAPVIFAPNWFAATLGQPQLAPYLWLLPIGVLFAAAYDALQYWASRKKRYLAVSKTRMTRAIGGVGTQLGIGVAGTGPFGLLLGHMLLSGFGFIGLARSILANDRELLSETNTSGLIVSARKYRQFPIYSVPEALLNTAGLEISILVIAAMAIGPEAGFLMLAMRVIGLPMNFVGASVGQVFLTDAPERYKAGEIAEFTKQTMLSLFKVGAVPMLVVGMISPMLFPVIFGEEWTRAGTILAWLTPMFMLQFIVSPVSIVPHVAGRLDWAMWMQAVMCAVRIGAVVIAAKLNPSILVEVFAVSGAVSYLLAIILTYQIARSAKRGHSAVS